MDAIGSIQTIVTQVVTPQPSQAAAVIPSGMDTSGNAPGTTGTTDQTAYNPQVADQQRYAAVQRMSQNIANYYVVGDKVFTIFKDATGQYITRFTSLRDGKVTYVPEPELFKQGGSTAPLLKIQA